MAGPEETSQGKAWMWGRGAAGNWISAMAVGMVLANFAATARPIPDPPPLINAFLFLIGSIQAFLAYFRYNS
jgi:hypothetical protein